MLPFIEIEKESSSLEIFVIHSEFDKICSSFRQPSAF